MANSKTINPLTKKMIECDDHVAHFITNLREELRLPIEDIAAILIAAARRLQQEAITGKSDSTIWRRHSTGDVMLEFDAPVAAVGRYGNGRMTRSQFLRDGELFCYLSPLPGSVISTMNDRLQE